MAEFDKDMCRKAAAECVQLARMTADPAAKEALLARAQTWLKLAYASSEAEFGRLVSELNEDSMAPPKPMQRQPMQQQQSKTEPEDKT